MKRLILAALLCVGCTAIATPTAPSEAPSEPPAAPAAPASTGQAGLIGQLPAPDSCPNVKVYWPNPTCAPGVQNPRVVEANLAQTVCDPTKRYTDPQDGHAETWIAHERAFYFPLRISSKVKHAVFLASGLQHITNPTTQRPYDERDVELDHVWPIEGGGAPNDIRNLYAQPWEADGKHPTGGAPRGYGAQTKDKQVEDVMHAQLCGRSLHVSEGRQFLAQHWSPR